jgi:hypothetical protein
MTERRSSMTKQDMTPKERAAAAKKAREFDAAFKSARRAAREAEAGGPVQARADGG